LNQNTGIGHSLYQLGEKEKEKTNIDDKRCISGEVGCR